MPAEEPREGAAVLCDAEVQSREDAAADRTNGRSDRADGCYEIQDLAFRDVAICGKAHATFLCSVRRNDTSTDFDVGVSLCSPAVDSGTSTFNSG